MMNLPNRPRASKAFLRILRMLAFGGVLVAGTHISIVRIMASFLVSNEATIASLTGSATIIIVAGVVSSVLTEVLRLMMGSRSK